MLNKIFLMGRIVNDLELKTTQSGVAVCQFRIAVDRQYQKQGEERVSDFFNISCWRGTAEFVSKWFSKGRMILVEGELQTRQYTDKNGNPAMWYEIVADNVYFTGEKKDDTQTAAVNYAPPEPTVQTIAESQSAQVTEDFAVAAADNDDYPF